MIHISLFCERFLSFKTRWGKFFLAHVTIGFYDF